ncbi:MAG: membrane protein insertase YidC [Kiritimatiellales bacterium]
MKKNDLIIVVVLLALMFGWMRYYPLIEQKFFPRPEKPAPAEVQTPAVPPELPAKEMEDAISGAADKPVSAPYLEAVTPAEEKPANDQDRSSLPLPPEEFVTLSNKHIDLTLSSYGGTVVSAVLKEYPAENHAGSGPVELDFAAVPALRYAGIPAGAGILSEGAGSATYIATLADGVIFQREFKLDDEYLMTVTDSFKNGGATPWKLPELCLSAGAMSNTGDAKDMRGFYSLGVDTFSAAEGVRHWGRDMLKIFRSVPVPDGMVSSTAEMIAPRPVDWIASKNKFFVQIVTPSEAAKGFNLLLRREGEGKKVAPVEVAAEIIFPAELIAANEVFTRTTRVYTGPKDFLSLKTQGMEQVEVMEFKSTGFWKFMNPVMYPIKVALLWGLNALYVVVRNYGVAIMLLTVIVRIIFWPITHKGTESMRRMAALQPQMQALRDKYKDNPQRLQQETMKFYKENKVNPMGGCLPMLIQIPVFFALFTVLRSAIELRFSKFLWVQDLSTAENLFEGMVPVLGSLNILPILMAVTTIWQQKLTPTAGDPQQQRMMMFMMPLMMLFLLYSMPSGLVLYWTTGNLLMIIQMLIKKKKAA